MAKRAGRPLGPTYSLFWDVFSELHNCYKEVKKEAGSFSIPSLSIPDFYKKIFPDSDVQNVSDLKSKNKIHADDVSEYQTAFKNHPESCLSRFEEIIQPMKNVGRRNPSLEKWRETYLQKAADAIINMGELFEQQTDQYKKATETLKYHLECTSQEITRARLTVIASALHMALSYPSTQGKVNQPPTPINSTLLLAPKNSHPLADYLYDEGNSFSTRLDERHRVPKNCNTSFICGGPGTGKLHTVKEWICGRLAQKGRYQRFYIFDYADGTLTKTSVQPSGGTSHSAFEDFFAEIENLYQQFLQTEDYAAILIDGFQELEDDKWRAMFHCVIEVGMVADIFVLTACDPDYFFRKLMDDKLWPFGLYRVRRPEDEELKALFPPQFHNFDKLLTRYYEYCDRNWELLKFTADLAQGGLLSVGAFCDHIQNGDGFFEILNSVMKNALTKPGGKYNDMVGRMLDAFGGLRDNFMRLKKAVEQFSNQDLTSVISCCRTQNTTDYYEMYRKLDQYFSPNPESGGSSKGEFYYYALICKHMNTDALPHTGVAVCLDQQAYKTAIAVGLLEETGERRGTVCNVKLNILYKTALDYNGGERQCPPATLPK